MAHPNSFGARRVLSAGGATYTYFALDALRERGFQTVEEVDIVEEDVRFSLPPEVQVPVSRLAGTVPPSALA
jgi:hypothetical protein